ncbi:MAG TPA: hypothetical protein EYO84_10680, partial [Planctomycetes bacterium]|nr:hypothetical protein [Planctomycetota bacterium]
MPNPEIVEPTLPPFSWLPHPDQPSEDPTPEGERESSVALDEELEKLWKVIVWNDPVNLMSYVVYVLQRLFGYSIDIGDASRSVTVKLEGTYLNTNNANGSDASITRTVSPGTTE